MPAKIVLDVGGFEQPGALHRYLAEAFAFPEWYGHNWDAFWDCVRDPALSKVPETIAIRGFSELLATLPREARLLKESLEDLGEYRAGITLEWA